jgi:hypothetical protein
MKIRPMAGSSTGNLPILFHAPKETGEAYGHRCALGIRLPYSTAIGYANA